ncbi:hypothetical protein BDY17DRAFT_309378 [Neohortaea acidophila]|uniref:LIM zinc-binding domain-containing protein n=1 Tax=Neohortaea acidophila TaxID=245834 RepID=A0A6A6PVK7_9PEZI|nr:uncharacterized protein BDY17DRAFT_309378 [Neohortaea acidophila]KAF2484052.1 hypothetical protein BDY17DRAFT_309378 [Neohortaea acidophila]
MSLAATLAASGMRPASFLPTIKCSNCGDEIEIAAMSEHACSAAPTSPKAAPPSWSNPFTLRQINASENKPLQPSPLQFDAPEPEPKAAPRQFSPDDNKPAQPSPLQFTSEPSEIRPRAPTEGSSQLPSLNTSRPALPRINSELANQPFLGRMPPTPLSPSSSVRSGSSSSSKNVPPKRAMTTPAPRLWDPRPPSPELSANLDCAFPPFPTPAVAKRKASTASQSSARSAARRDVSAAESRSPVGSQPEDAPFSKLELSKTGLDSRRPSNEDRSQPSTPVLEKRPSPRIDPLSPLAESPASEEPPAPAIISPLASAVMPMSPTSESGFEAFPAPPPAQNRVPPQRPPRPDDPLTPANITFASLLGESPSPSMSSMSSMPKSPAVDSPPPPAAAPKPPAAESGFKAFKRALSLKRVASRKPARPEEPMPPATVAAQLAMAYEPSQKKPPPSRPARPAEGIPDALLNPLSLQTRTMREPLSPRPWALQESDRSQTVPLSSTTDFDLLTSPTLSKMASEPALRFNAELTSAGPPPSPPRINENLDDSRLDPRKHDAPPVPPLVDAHRSLESLHKSYASGASTDCSETSLGDLSFGRSNTTAEQSPVISAASSLDLFSPLSMVVAKEQDEEDDALRVPALNVTGPKQLSFEVEEVHDETPHVEEVAPLRTTLCPVSPLEPEAVARDEQLDDDALPSPPLPSPPAVDTWGMESPMDPALSDGIFGQPGDAPSPSPVSTPTAPLSLTPDPLDVAASLSPTPAEPVRESLIPDTAGEIHSPAPLSPPLVQESFSVDLQEEAASPNPLSISPAEVSLAPDSPKLERLSSSVCDPKRPHSTASTQVAVPEAQCAEAQQAPPDANFQDFNFGESVASELLPSDSSASSSRKASESAGSTTSEPSQPTITSPEAPPIPQSGVESGLIRKGTTGAKASCRGCRQRIEGKSVKAADGRLTGRWHRACFVCHTCASPFTTADFYVFNNHPYCEQHYHEMNGSVCHACHRGIEGPFLETSSGPPAGHEVRKYHRRCFTCVECRMVLSDGYFEIGGMVHCERHALAAMRQQAARRAPPPGTVAPRLSSGLRAESFKAERRRTRLMQS